MRDVSAKLPALSLGLGTNDEAQMFQALKITERNGVTGIHPYEK